MLQPGASTEGAASSDSTHAGDELSAGNGHDGEVSQAVSSAADAGTLVSPRDGEIITHSAIQSDKGFVEATGLEGFANSPMAGEGDEGGSGESDEDDDGVEMRVLLR